MKSLVIKFFGKYGWGDVIYPLMFAHRLSAEHKCHVDLQFDWRTSPDEKYSIDDSHTMREIVDIVMPLFISINTNVTVLHNLNYTGEQYWSLPSGTMWWPSKNPVDTKKKIVVWTPLNNVEHPDKRYKAPMTKDMLTADDKNSWPVIVSSLRKQYPSYEIVELSYRDNFLDVMKHVQESRFCFGYYGCGIPFVSMFNKPMFTTANKKTIRHAPWLNYVEEVNNILSYESHVLRMEEDIIKATYDYIDNNRDNRLNYALNVFKVNR